MRQRSCWRRMRSISSSASGCSATTASARSSRRPVAGGHAGVEHRDGGQPQPAHPVGGLGREPAGQLPRPGRGGRRAALVRDDRRRPRAPGRPPRRARPRRGPGARPGPASPAGSVAGQRPVGGPPVGAWGVVVGRRAHQRVAERRGGRRRGRRRRAPRRSPARRPRGRCSRRALMIRTRSPSGSAAATSRAPSTAGGSRSSSRSTTRWPDDPIGSGSGSSAPPGPLVGVEHVGRLARAPAGRRRWPRPARGGRSPR